MEYSGNYDDVNGLYEEALDLATIDDEECIRCYDTIIGINSGEGMAWRGKGLALGRLGRPQEAISCFDRALEIDPYDDIAQRSKDIELEEIKAMDTRTHSPDESSLISQGLQLNIDGKHEEAIQCFDRALEIDPTDESTWESKGDTLNSLGKHEEAIQCFDRALEIDPENDYALAMKGACFAILHKHEEAMQCYDRALEIDPENANYKTMKDELTNFVDTLEQSIDDPEERKRFSRNLENFADPENAFVEGTRFFTLKNFKEAIPYLKKAKSTPEVNGMLGMCLRNIQKYDESLTYFDKALSVEPENDMFLNFKGFSLRDLERWDEYLDIQTKLLKINPSDDHALCSKGMALGELSKYDEAIFCLDEALKINPLNDLAWSSKGVTLFDLSKYDEAIFCYDKALEIDSDDEVIWFNKGEALDKLSKYSESILCYEKGLEINPDPDITDWQSGSRTAMQCLDLVKAKLSKESSSKTYEKIEMIEKSEPLDVLKMRLAKGEISLEEFNEIKEHLE
ncbi:tetratricopeptide repeat protein [Nitrosopumilus sp.]|nr:tetratricopeptide repeat protein [Nitrosopumilus sp.]